jgi:riboflavin transporter FmnP
MAKTMSVITGSIVGGITLFMLILNVTMILGFYKNFTDKKAAA